MLFIRSPDLPCTHGTSGGITATELISVLNYEMAMMSSFSSSSSSSSWQRGQTAGGRGRRRRSGDVGNPQPSQPSSSSSSASSAAGPSTHDNNNNNHNNHNDNNNDNNNHNSDNEDNDTTHRPPHHLVLILRSPTDLMLPSHAWKKPGKKVVKKRPKKMSLDELMRYESDSEEDEEDGDKDAFGSLYSMTQSFLTTGALGKVTTAPAVAVVPPPGRCRHQHTTIL